MSTTPSNEDIEWSVTKARMTSIERRICEAKLEQAERIRRKFREPGIGVGKFSHYLRKEIRELEIKLSEINT